MRQRVSMARTLAAQPKILLMDEPFASLDEQTRLLLGDKVLQIQQELKQTTLLITHNITEAVQLSDRILVMTYRPGRVKRMVRDQAAAPAHLRDRVERGVRALRGADLERPARGGDQGPARRGEPEAARGREAMSAAAALAKSRYVPMALGVMSFVVVRRRGRAPHPRRRHQPLHRADAVRHHRRLPARHRRGGRAVALPAHRRRGVLGQHPGHDLRRRRAACCSTAISCCGSRPRPGWRRWRPPRWC